MATASSTGPYLIWLHGLGDTNGGWRRIWNGNKTFARSTFPQAPTRAITCNEGFRMPGWADICVLPIRAKDVEVDMEGYGKTAAMVHGLIEAAIADGVPETSIFVGGFSQGGAAALVSVMTYKARLGGCIVFSGWLPDPSFVEGSPNGHLPVFWSHGSQDTVIYPETRKEARKCLVIKEEDTHTHHTHGHTSDFVRCFTPLVDAYVKRRLAAVSKK